MTKRRKKALKKTKGSGRTMPPYPIEFRLEVARLHIENGAGPNHLDS